MKTVYIANKGFHDYTAATSFGKLRALTVGNVNLQATDRLEEKIQFGLREAQADDILLLGGAPIIGAYAMGYMLRRFGYVNLLFHDIGKREYVLRSKMDFSERRIDDTLGGIKCPTCGRVIHEAPPGVTAVATENCELCQAEAEEAREAIA